MECSEALQDGALREVPSRVTRRIEGRIDAAEQRLLRLLDAYVERLPDPDLQLENLRPAEDPQLIHRF